MWWHAGHGVHAFHTGCDCALGFWIIIIYIILLICIYTHYNVR